MGNGGAKKTNQMLAKQTGIANQIGSTMGGRSETNYAQQQALRNELLGNYRGLYSGIGEDGGGGGVGGGIPEFESTLRENEAMPFYRDMMRTGGYSPDELSRLTSGYEGIIDTGGFDPGDASAIRGLYSGLIDTGGYSEADKANILSYATGPISGMFEGLKRNLETRAAGRGGYTSGLSALSRDSAYQAGEMAKGVAGDLAERVIGNRIRGGEGLSGFNQAMTGNRLAGLSGLGNLRQNVIGNRFRGGEGVSSLDETYMQRQEREANARRDLAARAASAGASRSNADRAYQLEILSRMQGLMPEDLPYVDRQLAANQQAIGSIGSRVSETPMWQSALASAVPAAAGAAAGAFAPGAGKMKKSTPYNYGF